MKRFHIYNIQRNCSQPDNLFFNPLLIMKQSKTIITFELTHINNYVYTVYNVIKYNIQ
jgi:hypothetical protein